MNSRVCICHCKSFLCLWDKDDSCLTALNVRCILNNATVSQPIWVWYISHILNVNKNSSKGGMKS